MSESSVIGLAGVVPVVAEPSLKSERVTELVTGETAAVLDRHAEWRRVRLDGDGMEGWLHQGYVVEAGRDAALDWRARAAGWSEGAVVRSGQTLVRLPLRARVELTPAGVRLPDGRAAELIAGSVLPYAEVVRSARRISAGSWAVARFGGTPYQWGGVTPWGADCSGLVQTTFLARGVSLPRDSHQQAENGRAVDPEHRRAGDLVFFVENGARVTHVAMLGPHDTLVHSALSCGGFVVEPWDKGSRAEGLRSRLRSVRRLEDS